MPAKDHLCVLTLQLETVEGNPDWPDLAVRVDGQDPFAATGKQWRGFDPADLLGSDSPLVPEDFGRRIAVARCSCGIGGCGALAPVIVASADGRRISWVDFQAYVGIFDGPVPVVTPEHGRPKGLPDLHFDRDQYLAEVERARQDRSWETPRRQIARLVNERLRPLDLVMPPDLTFRWAAPAWDDREGVTLSFERAFSDDDRSEVRQRILHLRSTLAEPDRAAAEITAGLLSVPPQEWLRTFEERRGQGRRAY